MKLGHTLVHLAPARPLVPHPFPPPRPCWCSLCVAVPEGENQIQTIWEPPPRGKRHETMPDPKVETQVPRTKCRPRQIRCYHIVPFFCPCWPPFHYKRWLALNCQLGYATTAGVIWPVRAELKAKCPPDSVSSRVEYWGTKRLFNNISESICCFPCFFFSHHPYSHILQPHTLPLATHPAPAAAPNTVNIYWQPYCAHNTITTGHRGPPQNNLPGGVGLAWPGRNLEGVSCTWLFLYRPG